ncbi:MAG: outer membrane beta-barrel protein [Candidatus Kapaibacterium sp.]
MKKLLVLLFAIFAFSTAKSQTLVSVDGQVGLMASIQTQQYTVGVPIWFSESISFIPHLGFYSEEDIGTELGLGGALRFHFREDEIKPYAGFRLAVENTSPDEGDSTMDLLIGGVFGGEYFFNNNFSAGVEAQLNIINPDDHSPQYNGLTIHTEAAVYMAVYF